MPLTEKNLRTVLSLVNGKAMPYEKLTTWPGKRTSPQTVSTPSNDEHDRNCRQPINRHGVGMCSARVS
jgi:hypothetical protein